jgi:hypothetical protein
MIELLVTYQPHYRTNAVSCIVSIPSVFKTSEERLKHIQTSVQDYHWDYLSAEYKMGMRKDQYANMAILYISNLNF